LMLTIPILGKAFRTIVFVRYMRVLSATVGGGMPLVQSLHAATSVVDNEVYKKSMEYIERCVTIGQSLHSAMAHTQLFPHRMVQMITIGEASGTLDNMFNHLADYYDDQLENMLENTMQLLEPMIILFVSILVGGLVTAMYLPVFRLGEIF